MVHAAVLLGDCAFRRAGGGAAVRPSRLARVVAWAPFAVLTVWAAAVPAASGDAREEAALWGFAALLAMLPLCPGTERAVGLGGASFALAYAFTVDPGTAGDLSLLERAATLAAVALAGCSAGYGIAVARGGALRAAAGLGEALSGGPGRLRLGTALKTLRTALLSVDALERACAGVSLGLWPEALRLGLDAATVVALLVPLWVFLRRGWRRPVTTLLRYANGALLAALAYLAGVTLTGAPGGGQAASLLLGGLACVLLVEPRRP